MGSLVVLFRQAGKLAWKHRKNLVILVLVLVLIVVWRSRPEGTGFQPEPYRAPLVKVVEKIKTVEKVIKVPVYIPTPKQADKIEQEIAGPLPAGDLLGIHEVKASETDSKVVITQEKPGEPLTVTVFPERPRLFKWELKQRSAEAWSDVDPFDPDVEYRQGLFRIGPVHIGARVKQDNILHDPFKPVIQIGARFTF